jgi:predicted site-specific integrase-resolvase
LKALVSKTSKSNIFEGKELFIFKFIKKMFESYGCEVIVINGLDVSSEEELAADMMSLLASFSGKFYGKRSAEKRKKKNMGE